MGFTRFLFSNLGFSFSIILISFIFGWVLYTKLVLRNINLRDALFEKDNIAAWIEYIGAFVFPTLYLSAKALGVSDEEHIWIDLLTCIGNTLAYIMIFTILRMGSSMVVQLIASSDGDKKISLNDEIYKQKNSAGAILSVVLSLIFVALIEQLNLSKDINLITTSLLKMGNILIFILIAVLFFILRIRYKSTIFHEIFVDNNTAASVLFLGYIYGVYTIVKWGVITQVSFNLLELAMMLFITMVIFCILSEIFRFVFCKIVKVDLDSEIFDQNNVGAAIGAGALYIGIALILTHYI